MHITASNPQQAEDAEMEKDLALRVVLAIVW